MKIAIVGAGNSGTATAADLSMKGHNVTLVKASKSKIHNDNFEYLLANEGKIVMREVDESIYEAQITHISSDLSVIKDSDIVFIAIQSNYHDGLLQRMAAHLRDGQMLLINPGYFSSAYVLQHMPHKDITVIEAQSSFIDCRIIEPGKIHVGFRNVRNPVGVYPLVKKEDASKILEQLGFNIVMLDSVVEAALHNPNLIVHTVGAIMSIPRIEKTEGNYVMYHEVFTPSVWNILENLDSEKMDVLEYLGSARLPYVEACKYRNSLDDGRDAKQVFFDYAMMPTRALGPTSVDSRYITEDVPQGLVMLESIGKSLGIETPVATALIEIANSALQRDFRKNGRSLKNLGVSQIKSILEDAKRTE